MKPNCAASPLSSSDSHARRALGLGRRTVCSLGRAHGRPVRLGGLAPAHCGGPGQLLLIGGRGLEEGGTGGPVEAANEDREAVDVGHAVEEVLRGVQAAGGVGLEHHDRVVGLDLAADGVGGRLHRHGLLRRRRGRRLHLQEVRPVGRRRLLLPLRAALAGELVGRQLIHELLDGHVEGEVRHGGSVEAKKTSDSSSQSAAVGLDWRTMSLQTLVSYTTNQ